MDRKQLLGLLLIFGLFYAWSVMNNQSRKKIDAEQFVQDSIAQADLERSAAQTATLDPAPAAEAAKPDSVAQAQVSSRLLADYGPFAAAANGTDQTFSLENAHLKIDFSSKGGKISSAQLKEYKKIVEDTAYVETKIDLFLMEDEKNRFEFLLPVPGAAGSVVSTQDLYFVGNQSGNTLSLKADVGEGRYIEQVYTLEEDGFTLDYKLNLVGLDKVLDRTKTDITLNWVNYLDRIEKNTNFEKFYTSIYYKKVGENSDYCSCRKDDEDLIDEDRLEWVSHVHQFFNSSLIANSVPFSAAIVKTKMTEDESEDLKLAISEIAIPYTATSDYSFDMDLIIAPNEYRLLKSYDKGLEEIIPFGRSIFGTINRHLMRPSFNFLSNLIGSKGIAIIVLIFILKMLLYPLMYKMLYSQAKMGALKPEIAKMGEKYKEDPQKKQVETMKMYREYGVNPMGGCMPMILQMPIWYALFRFFPASINFRQESFLWATDLSSYDAFMNLGFELPFNAGHHISLFTILWAATTIIYTYYNTKHMDMSANPAMKYVQYFMPLMFLVFFNNYASGLTCYMFFSNLFNIAQTVITKRFVFNDDKIREELRANQKKPKKKKGKFASRLEDAMKASQAAQAKKNKK